MTKKPSNQSVPLYTGGTGQRPDPSIYNPPRKDFDHFSDPYFQRGLGRLLDRSGGDILEAIRDQDNKVIWQRAAICPNTRLDPNSRPTHVSKCPFCKGDGLIYWEEQEISVAMTSLGFSDHFHLFGTYRSGISKVVFPPGKFPNVGDRLVLTSDYSLFTENIHVTQRIDQQRGNQRFRLRFDPIRVEQLLLIVDEEHWNLDGLPPVVDDDGNSRKALLQIDHDQIQIDGNHIISVRGRIPPTTSVSVVYWYLPQFVITEVTSLSRDAFSGKELDELQSVPRSQFDDPQSGWSISAIAAFDFLMKRTDISSDASSFYTEYTGDTVRNTHNRPVAPPAR